MAKAIPRGQRPWDYVPPTQIEKKERAKRVQIRKDAAAKKQAAYDEKHRYETYHNPHDHGMPPKDKRTYFYVFHIVGYDKRGHEVVRAAATSSKFMRETRANIYKQRKIWIHFRVSKEKHQKLTINR
jgi:hypothetical protein